MVRHDEILLLLPMEGAPTRAFAPVVCRGPFV
jgi:hypothetical protein